jgi:hypothetical protein
VKIDILMEPGAIEEQITVVGQSPVIDTRKTKVAANYTSDVVESLPVARRMSEIVNLAPGIMSPHPSIAGQGSGVAHGFGVRHIRGEYSLDGASYRSTYGHGGMPAAVSTVRVEETQVSTTGQDITNVEGGPTVNMVSKRGGNKLAGESYLALLDEALQSKKGLPKYMTDPTPTGLGYKQNSGILRTYDYGAALGGPILKDHLWFFGSWGVIDSWNRMYTGLSGDRYYTPDMYGKINFMLGKTTAEVTYSHANALALNVPWFSNSPNNLDRLNPANTYTFQATQTLWEKLLVSAKVTYFDKSTFTNQANFVWTGAGDVTYDEGRTYNPPSRYYTYNWFKSPPYNTEATGHWQRYGSVEKRPYIVLEAQYFAERLFGGDHELKLGFDRNYARLVEEYMAPNQAFVGIRPASQVGADPNNAPNKGAYGAYWAYIWTYCDRYGEKRAERTGLYAQDIANYGRFTFTFGLRVDWHAWAWEPVKYHGLAPEDKAVTAWDQWTGPMETAGGRLPLDPSFSPRLSLVYDLSGKGTDLIKLLYANYGGALDTLAFRAGFKKGNTRGEFYLPFYDLDGDYVPDWDKEFYLGFPTPDQVDMMRAKYLEELVAYRAVHGATAEAPWNYFTYPGAFGAFLSFTGNPLGRLASGAAPTDFLADDFDPERVVEMSAGYEKQLGSDMSVQFFLSYKKEYNLPWLRGYYGTPSSYTLMPIDVNIAMGVDPVTGWTVYTRDPAIKNANGYMITTYKKYYTYFKGAQLIFTKRLSHGWMLKSSFDYMDWRSHWDKSELGSSTLFDYYNDAPVAVQEYASTEPMANSRWHFKIMGLIQLPFGFNLSGFVDAREGYLVNKWVSAYLGTSLPESGSKYGKYRYPNLYYTNLTLERTFRFSDTVSSTVYITGYNITDTLVTTLINQTKVPTALDQPTEVNRGRIFQLGVRFSFR